MKSTLLALLFLFWAPSASAVSILHGPTTPNAPFFFKVFALHSGAPALGKPPGLEFFEEGSAASESEALIKAMLSGISALLSWWPTYGNDHDDLKVAWTWVLPSGTFETPGKSALSLLGYTPSFGNRVPGSADQTGLVSLALTRGKGGPVFGFVGEFGPQPHVATVPLPAAMTLLWPPLLVLGLYAILLRARRRRAGCAALPTPAARANPKATTIIRHRSVRP